MHINTTDGSKSVTGQAQGNLNTVLGAVGTAFGLMNGTSLFNGNHGNGDSRYVTKSELDLIQQIQSKDALLAIKESESYTDKKLVEVYSELAAQNNRQNDKMEEIRRGQEAINAQQMAYNASANANIDVLKAQVAALSGVTKVYIPSSNVCQTGCGCTCNCNQ